MRREVKLPTQEGDAVGQRVTLTVEAWITKIEGDLIDVGTYDEPEMALPGEQWTTFVFGAAKRMPYLEEQTPA